MNRVPCQVSPLVLLDLLPAPGFPLPGYGAVVDPDLVTLEDLCSAALLAAGPGAVTLPVPQLVRGHLHQSDGLVRRKVQRNSISS